MGHLNLDLEGEGVERHLNCASRGGGGKTPSPGGEGQEIERVVLMQGTGSWRGWPWECRWGTYRTGRG